MALRLYQKDCLPSREICNDCKLVEAHYMSKNKPSMGSLVIKKHYIIIEILLFYTLRLFFNRDLSSNVLKSLPATVFANLTKLKYL